MIDIPVRQIRIFEHLNGSLEVKSSPGNGTLISVSVPRQDRLYTEGSESELNKKGVATRG